jgi:hypothetical protein
MCGLWSDIIYGYLRSWERLRNPAVALRSALIVRAFSILKDDYIPSGLDVKGIINGIYLPRTKSPANAL